MEKSTTTAAAAASEKETLIVSSSSRANKLFALLATLEPASQRAHNGCFLCSIIISFRSDCNELELPSGRLRTKERRRAERDKGAAPNHLDSQFQTQWCQSLFVRPSVCLSVCLFGLIVAQFAGQAANEIFFIRVFFICASQTCQIKMPTHRYSRTARRGYQNRAGATFRTQNSQPFEIEHN